MRLNVLKQNKGLLVFTISSLTYSFCQMLFGLIVLKWISPEEMGLWNGVTIASPYISFLQLGLFVALNRELPYLIGKGDKERAIKQVQTAASYANYVSVVILVATIAVSLFFYFKDVKQLFLIVIICFGLSTAMKILQNYLVVTYRSSNDFKKLGYIYLSIIPVYLLSVLFVYSYNFTGFLIYQITVPFVLVTLLFINRPYKNKPFFHKNSFRELLKTGIPFFGINYFRSISDSFKRIILLKYLGITALGLFSPALAILLVGRMLPKILGSFIYPKMSKKFGETGNKRNVWRINFRSAMLTTLLAVPAVIILYFILPILFQYVFTEYNEAYKPTSIILLSVIFIIPQMAYNGLNSVKAYRVMVVVTVLKLLIYWFVILWVFKKVGGLEGIAWGIVCSDFLFSLVVLCACYYELVVSENKIKE